MRSTPQTVLDVAFVRPCLGNRFPCAVSGSCQRVAEPERKLRSHQVNLTVRLDPLPVNRGPVAVVQERRVTVLSKGGGYDFTFARWTFGINLGLSRLALPVP